MTTITETGRELTTLQDLVDRIGADLPTAMIAVNLVWHDAVLVVAGRNLPEWIIEAGGVPLDSALCAFTVRHETPLIVDDTYKYPLYAENAVVVTCGVRSYAGVPLFLDGGLVGTLVAFDTAPGAFDTRHLRALEALAPVAEDMLLSSIWR